MADRLEELELVERYLEAARIAHESGFRIHRELVDIGADGEHTRKLLSESAAIVLAEIPALVRDWHVMEREWFETELLDPACLDRKTQALKASFTELGPALNTLRGRQDEIVTELVDLLDRAKRG